mgnify:CR=1 FL=1
MIGVPLSFDENKELDVDKDKSEVIISEYNNNCRKNERKLVILNDLIYLKNLNIKPYHNTSDFYFLKPFEDNFNIIQDEFNSVFKKKYWNVSPDSKRYPVFSEMNDNWTTLCFYYEGKWNTKMKNLCPVTYKLLKKVPYLFSWACFSRLKPYTDIPFHKGETNINLTCHLGIKNLNNTSLVVNGIKKKWENGKCLVFDDTFMHGVKNNNSKERVVLAFDFINPYLSRNEKNRLKKTYIKLSKIE